jgi:hypothetical protein
MASRRAVEGEVGSRSPEQGTGERSGGGEGIRSVGAWKIPPCALPSSSRCSLQSGQRERAGRLTNDEGSCEAARQIGDGDEDSVASQRACAERFVAESSSGKKIA